MIRSAIHIYRRPSEIPNNSTDIREDIIAAVNLSPLKGLIGPVRQTTASLALRAAQPWLRSFAALRLKTKGGAPRLFTFLQASFSGLLSFSADPCSISHLHGTWSMEHSKSPLTAAA
jgi:hypothetical protein